MWLAKSPLPPPFPPHKSTMSSPCGTGAAHCRLREAVETTRRDWQCSAFATSWHQLRTSFFDHPLICFTTFGNVVVKEKPLFYFTKLSKEWLFGCSTWCCFCWGFSAKTKLQGFWKRPPTNWAARNTKCNGLGWIFGVLNQNRDENVQNVRIDSRQRFRWLEQASALQNRELGESTKTTELIELQSRECELLWHSEKDGVSPLGIEMSTCRTRTDNWALIDWTKAAWGVNTASLCMLSNSAAFLTQHCCESSENLQRSSFDAVVHTELRHKSAVLSEATWLPWPFSWGFVTRESLLVCMKKLKGQMDQGNFQPRFCLLNESFLCHSLCSTETGYCHQETTATVIGQ